MCVYVQVNEQFTTYTATDVAEGLQDFLICIEMFLAALAHAYAFPPRVSGGGGRWTKGGWDRCQLSFAAADSSSCFC